MIVRTLTALFTLILSPTLVVGQDYWYKDDLGEQVTPLQSKIILGGQGYQQISLSEILPKKFAIENGISAFYLFADNRLLMLIRDENVGIMYYDVKDFIKIAIKGDLEMNNQRKEMEEMHVGWLPFKDPSQGWEYDGFPGLPTITAPKTP